MAKIKLSQWHDGSVNPVHIGVYERKDPNGEQYSNCRNHHSWWNGLYWATCDENIDMAYHCRHSGPSHSQNLQWRGIIK